MIMESSQQEKNFEYLDNESQWERKNNWKELGKMFVKEFHVFIHKMDLNLEFKTLGISNKRGEIPVNLC